MVNLSCVQIAAGEEHSVMLTTLGHVYISGKGLAIGHYRSHFTA